VERRSLGAKRPALHDEVDEIAQPAALLLKLLEHACRLGAISAFDLDAPATVCIY
jgi:hypothetical protein